MLSKESSIRTFGSVLCLITMEIALTTVGIFLTLIGIAGLAVPFIPDVPLVASGVVLVLVAQHAMSVWAVAALLILTILAFVADWLLVIYGAKKLGATRAGSIGGLIGLSLAFLSIPMGIVAGFAVFPAIGATIGELYGRRHDKTYIHAPIIGIGVGIFAAMALAVKVLMIGLLVMVGLLALGLH